MAKEMIIYWLPRIIAILIVAFFSMFILEGFSPDFTWMDSLMHLLMALVALGSAILAWKWPKIGGWIFVLFGWLYLVMIFRSQFWSGLLIGIIPLLAGILFLIGGFRKYEKH